MNGWNHSFGCVLLFMCIEARYSTNSFLFYNMYCIFCFVNFIVM